MIVGIIGIGVVGGAMLQVFKEAGKTVIAYDKFRPGFDDDSIHFEALIDADLIFVSVPTKTNEDGTQDLGPLEDVLDRLTKIKYRGIVVSKCTTLPGTTRRLKEKFTNVRLVHCPEFLTAANAYEDFKYQKITLLSGDVKDSLIVGEFFREISPRMSMLFFLKYESTEIAKYTHNCFLATKLSFLNEIYDVCKLHGVSYSEMLDGVLAYGKIGENHTKVPGLDGLRGWGGDCFPKDTKAFYHAMSANGIPMETLFGAILTNNKLRG